MDLVVTVTNHSTLFDSLLTKEQREKRSISEEAMDRRGWIVRYRVDDQTLFDLMFIKELIDRGQHEAGHCFLTAVEKSGAYPASCSLEAGNGAAAYQVGDLIGEKRMAFGSAYRFVLRECGEWSASALMAVMENIFKTSKEYGLCGSKLKKISESVSIPLRVLSRFYRTDHRQDPRSVVRRRKGS